MNGSLQKVFGGLAHATRWPLKFIGIFVGIGTGSEQDGFEAWKTKLLNFTSLVTVPMIVINLTIGRYVSPGWWFVWACVLVLVVFLNSRHLFRLSRTLFIGFWMLLTYIDTWYYNQFDSVSYFMICTSLMVIFLMDVLWMQLLLFLVNIVILHMPFYIGRFADSNEVDYFFFSRFLLIMIITIFTRKALYQTEQKLNKEKKNAIKTSHIISEQAEKIKANEKNKDTFFANASHELRTPLTLVLGRLEQLMTDEESYYSTHAKRLLNHLKKDSQQLMQLSDEIRELISLESDKLSLSFQKKDAVQLFRTITSFFHSSAQMKGVMLRFESNVKEQTIHVDQNKMEKVMYNLLSNALKHTDTGKEVLVMLSVESSGLLIRVMDEGLGIPKEDQPFIFDRYHQSSQRNSGGLGIGLAIVKELVELHGGKISFEGNTPSGSIFNLSLPLNLDQKTEESLNMTEIQKESLPPLTDQHTIPISNLTAPFERDTILIVDDHDEIRRYMVEILMQDYKLIEARDGKEALQKLETIPVDLIISDIMMPYMDGFELLENLSKHPRHGKIPVLMVSARHDIEDRLKILGHGVDNYLNKPFHKSELQLRIQLMLKQKTNHPELGMLVDKNVETLHELEKKALLNLDAFAIQNIGHDQVSIEQLADFLSTSRSGLFRLVKRLTGKTPSAYLKDIRFQYAHELLTKREVKSAREAAQWVGFKNSTDFSRQFQARFGIHPADLLQN